MTQTSHVVIVSEGLASKSWPGQDALGKRLRFSGVADKSGVPSVAPWLTIVGVVRDVTYRRLPRNPDADPDLYLPFADQNSQVAIALRTAVPPASIAATARAAIRGADASIAVFSVAPMNDLVEQQTSPSRFVMWLMGVFAAMALALAVVGIYGVLSYAVNRRTREIGLRMALGADQRAIVRLVLHQSFILVGAGIALGLGGAAAALRYLQAMLFGVGSVDPLTFSAVSLVFVAVGIVASYVPVRRATRVDPLIALKCD